MVDKTTSCEETVPLINVVQWVSRSVVNGPGERFVLWVQGCPFRCPGCINPSFLTFEEKHLMSEPMAQAPGLYHLTRRLKAAGLTAVSYSGYTLQELQNHSDPYVPLLLGQLDLLIDGRYVAQQSGQLPWRGSNNQEVHLLSPAYSHLAATAQTAHREVEFIVGENQFTSTGIFDSKLVRRLEEMLRESPDQISQDLRALDRLINQGETP
jgi:anaerobic ribonucleoside-triphosphate reductase activating protein